MSQLTQTTYRISNPLGLDACIDRIQTGLAGLTYQDSELNNLLWLEAIYPLAEINPESLEPEIRQSKDRAKSLQPDNRLKSYSFFVESGDTVGADAFTRVYALSLYVWFDSNRYALDTHNVREYFINALTQHFYTERRGNPELTIGNITRDRRTVWNGINTNLFQPNANPYRSFRIDFQAKFDTGCYNQNQNTFTQGNLTC